MDNRFDVYVINNFEGSRIHTVCKKHGVWKDKNCFEKESKVHKLYSVHHLINIFHLLLSNGRNSELYKRRHNS